MSQIVPFNDLLRQNNALKDELTDTSARVVASGWYVLGTENQRFEQEFSAYCGSDHTIGLANGSDALELGLRALGVTSGSVVVTVANAGGYATTAIRSIGAIPLYIDVTPDRFLLDQSKLGALLDFILSQQWLQLTFSVACARWPSSWRFAQAAAFRLSKIAHRPMAQ